MSNYTKGILIYLAGICATTLLGLVLLPPVEMGYALKFFVSVLPAGISFIVLLHYLTAHAKEATKKNEITK